MEKVLIVDVDCRVDPLAFFDFGLKTLSGKEMTKTMLNLEIWKQIDPWKTLLIFPGNGSNLVKKQIEESSPGWLSVWPYKSYVAAKRFWEPGQNPQAIVGIIGDGVYVGLKQVVIIDDVISSGETCSKVQRKNYIYTPGANWLAACWVRQRSAQLKKFSSVTASESAGEENKRAPINSLSTLIADRNICRVYSERNFFDRAQDFQALVESCRQ